VTGAPGGSAAGALAALHPDDVRLAAGLIRDGRVWDLSVELDPAGLPPVDARYGRAFERVDLVSPDEYRDAFGSGASGFHLDAVSGSVHQGTHIDGLAHIVHRGRIFGDIPESDARDADGWRVHGAETIAPIVGRAVLIDLVAARGGEALPGNHEIFPDELAGATRRQGVDIRAGDVVLVRTGKMAQLRDDREHFLERQPGIGVAAAEWLAEQGMVAYGSDTAGTEPQPIGDWERTVHVALLAERGIHLLEWLDLDGLASSGRHECFFVAAPLRFRGASGAWLRPVAIT
jgi:kynurenine formamidase